MTLMHLTSLTHREEDWYVALCPELDVASQGETPEQAEQNLTEPLSLFLETASDMEIQERLHAGQRVTSALIGASRPAQIVENVKAAEKTRFAEDELAAIEAILKSGND